MNRSVWIPSLLLATALLAATALAALAGGAWSLVGLALLSMAVLAAGLLRWRLAGRGPSIGVAAFLAVATMLSGWIVYASRPEMVAAMTPILGGTGVFVLFDDPVRPGCRREG